MGMLDHLRTWQFETAMAPAHCARVFAEALGGRGTTLTGSDWRVAISGDDRARRAVATYRGRAGAGAHLSFAATAGHDGTTSCVMAMTRTTKVYGVFTADARLFREAMNRVARRLRDNDAGLDLLKR